MVIIMSNTSELKEPSNGNSCGACVNGSVTAVCGQQTGVKLACETWPNRLNGCIVADWMEQPHYMLHLDTTTGTYKLPSKKLSQSASRPSSGFHRLICLLINSAETTTRFGDWAGSQRNKNNELTDEKGATLASFATYPKYSALVRVHAMPLFDNFAKSQKAQDCRQLLALSSSVRSACRQWSKLIIMGTGVTQKPLRDFPPQIDVVFCSFLPLSLLFFSNHFCFLQ